MREKESHSHGKKKGEPCLTCGQQWRAADLCGGRGSRAADGGRRSAVGALLAARSRKNRTGRDERAERLDFESLASTPSNLAVAWG